MKDIKVLGIGCARCTDTADLIQRTINEMGAQAQVAKDTRPEALVEHNVMSTPAVVIDGKVVHSGSMPKADQVRSWLSD
ncbi:MULTISPECIES: thioredoxin family protein [unclassified Ectothiorhodospira]|jgi:small redox-active disulfide protein 2|uniref:thioredoxin family protein n=1 Tax=unclassified Ectothiorhodospira TaxID=2684909 RepID=UPI001EE8E7B0|nr:MULTISPECIES: thioredoxin family protein [unclassified Ectothiorhodospira]MCG5514652.1 thioredoxin family protein [Ectothiorhodospira sp. 9100]MCG5517974.1 thioredoxin family protein [Ectothiorhodospira sp. 9905]